MTWAVALSPEEEERLRPLYARVLRLRHVDPGGLLCFVYFEGMVSLGLLLALAELVDWWGVLLLPLAVAGMVKVNDLVAAAVARSAARVPTQERDRFRRELRPAVGRAPVPVASSLGPTPDGTTGEASVQQTGPVPAGAVVATSARSGASAGGVGSRGATRSGAPGLLSPWVLGAGPRSVGTRPRFRPVTSGRSAAPGPARGGGPLTWLWMSGGRLVARLVPVGCPLSMAAMVRARLELCARTRTGPDAEPRPDLGIAERLRAGIPGMSPLLVTGPSTGVEGGSGAAGQAEPRAGSTGVAGGGSGCSSAPTARDRTESRAPVEESRIRQATASAVPGTDFPRNDRVVERPARHFPVWLEPLDSPGQRARQSARRRYE